MVFTCGEMPAMAGLELSYKPASSAKDCIIQKVCSWWWVAGAASICLTHDARFMCNRPAHSDATSQQQRRRVHAAAATTVGPCLPAVPISPSYAALLDDCGSPSLLVSTRCVSFCLSLLCHVSMFARWVHRLYFHQSHPLLRILFVVRD
eukprot:GHUV01038413.1.p1 GENE.GHUV01038413.1~~GHUV01038413.1.p1  ORF type:complete len:149 (-),score=14.84 GHUV01038413.1:371-817(-)